MAIDSAEVIEFVRKIITDENARFFKEPYMIRALNMASNFAFSRLLHAREDAFLTKETISIVQNDIDTDVRDFDLPDGTAYVSDYYYTTYRATTQTTNYRPRFATMVDPQVSLIGGRDYDITLMQFRFLQPLTAYISAPDTLEYYAKIAPTPLVKEGDQFSAWPNYMFNYFVHFVEWYCQKRDEHPEVLTYKDVMTELQMVRALIVNQAGRPDHIFPYWEDITGYMQDA